MNRQDQLARTDIEIPEARPVSDFHMPTIPALKKENGRSCLAEAILCLGICLAVFFLALLYAPWSLVFGAGLIVGCLWGMRWSGTK